MDSTAIFTAVLIAVWAYLLYSFINRYRANPSIELALWFIFFNMMLAVVSIIAAGSPVTQVVGEKCVYNVTSVNVTVSTCSYIIKPLPYNAVYMLPFWLAIITVFIGALFAVLAIVPELFRR